MKHRQRWACWTLTMCCLLAGFADAANPPKPSPAQQRATDQIMEFFAHYTNKLASAALADVETLEDWQQRRAKLRQQMLEVLGLSPLPKKTDLKATITGTVEHDDFIVEKLHFQSMPGLYVTANFYRPKNVEQPLPTILYLCGHGRIKKGDISYGNKAHYQHHPAWFVRHGYCALVIDTLQLGEIEGAHHGTYSQGRWWWLARGYTPAGVEAWNAVRSLDYLETRPEVDSKRIGVTGRSGGGTYTWWLAAIDDRPACLVPVAGITDLQNHIVDGCISGHCDCNYYPNIYGFDTVIYAALAAPRPLLFSNTDKDRIFPLDGVYRIHEKLRKIYSLYKATDKLGLLITEGPHQDTQQLRFPCFHWMNRWLKGEQPLLAQPATPVFEAEQLRVFEQIPADERNTTIDESFVPQAEPPAVPQTADQWEKLKESWLRALGEKTFTGWEEKPSPLHAEWSTSKSAAGLTVQRLDFTSEFNLRFPVFLIRKDSTSPIRKLIVRVADDSLWQTWTASLPKELHDYVAGDAAAGSADQGTASGELPVPAAFISESDSDLAVAIVVPRGVGCNQWDQRERENTQIRRRFFVLGRTDDEGRILDTRRAIQALSQQKELQGSDIVVTGEGASAGIALYAAIYESKVTEVLLENPTTSHRDGPILINVLRIFDLPQAVTLAFPRNVTLVTEDPKSWEWTSKVARLLGNPLNLQQADSAQK